MPVVHNRIMKTYYKRNLPHIQPPGATLFVTFRLFGSIPKRFLNELSIEHKHLNRLILKTWNRKSNEFTKYYNQQKRLIKKFDDYLHSEKTGLHFLKNESIAELVCSSMMFFDKERYDLLSYCVMSNHVHIVFTPLRINGEEYFALGDIMHSIKSYTAKEANKMLNRTGKPFWVIESFDHFCRDSAEVERVIEYVLNNPVNAGLVSSYDKWSWSYVKPDMFI